MGAYVVSMNLVGYLSMDDDPATYATWDEAYVAWRDFCREWADQSDEMYESLPCDDDQHTEECFGSDRVDVDAFLADLAMWLTEDKSPAGYSYVAVANDGNTYSLWFARVETLEA